MNRKEEYDALLRELENTPKALETAVEKALKREKTFSLLQAFPENRRNARRRGKIAADFRRFFSFAYVAFSRTGMV